MVVSAARAAVEGREGAIGDDTRSLRGGRGGLYGLPCGCWAEKPRLL